MTATAKRDKGTGNPRDKGQDGRQGKKRKNYHTTIEEGLLMRAQVRCLQERVDLNDIIEDLLEQWLSDKVKVKTL